jgi:hypothetical protein
MKNQFDTDEQLKKALRDFEAIPDSGSFDAILEKMNRKKKRRLFIIFFWTGLIALSGIAVPLMFGFYDTEKPSAVSTAETQAVASAQNKADTGRAHATLTSPDLRPKHGASSFINTSSSSEAPNPEAKTNPEGSHNRQPHASALTLSSSPGKNRPKKRSIEQAGNSGLAGTVHGAPAENKQDNALNAAAIDTAAISEAMYMTVIQILLPVDSGRQDVSVFFTEGAYPAFFISPEKKKTFSFYLGVQASPQFNSFAFSKNPNRDHGYNTSGANFSDLYLADKKSQSHLNFSLPFGIKAGLQINKRYEVFAGFGYQSFTEKEKLHAVEPSTLTSTVDPGVTYNAAANFSVPYKNQFRYLYYSLEGNRLFQTSKAIAFKVGLGLYGNQLLSSNYVFAVSPNAYGQTIRGRENLSAWLLTSKVKAGVIFCANRRFQLHISPGFFYSPTSVFKKEYVIRQKPYGMDVECLMLFRLFSR